MKNALFITLIALFAIGCGSEPKGDSTQGEDKIAICDCIEIYKGTDEAKKAVCNDMRKDAKMGADYKYCLEKQIAGDSNNKVNLVDSKNINIDGPSDGTYTLTPGDCEVIWTGKKFTGASHSGTIQITSGSIQIENGEIAKGKVVMDMTSMKNTDLATEKEQNDLVGHLKSADFFNTAEYPEAYFNITSSSRIENKYKFEGDLNIKGIVNPISSSALVAKNGETGLVCNGTMIVDRTKYDVKYGSNKFFGDLGDKAIKDQIMIKYDLSGLLKKK